MKTIRLMFSAGLAPCLAGCAAAMQAPVITAPTLMPSPSATPSLTPSPFPTETPTETPTQTPTPAPTATPDPFAGWRIDDLAARTYGGSGVVLGQVVKQNASFTQYLMSYPSDDLNITGLVNIPAGQGPFPVVIVNHGYGDPAIYYPGYDSEAVANTLATAGYIALMPDFRGYGGSDDGPNPFRIGYGIDVMHLVAQAGSLPGADPERIAVMGHSMGGGVSTWPMVIQGDQVDAVILYAAMSGDIGVSWQQIRDVFGRSDEMDLLGAQFGFPETNPSGYASASPVTYLDRVQMPVLLHHDTGDLVVPYQWSADLAFALTALDKEATLYTYEGQGHTFQGEAYTLMMQRTIAFLEASFQ